MGRLIWSLALVALTLGCGGCFKRSYDARPVVTFQDLGSGREDYASSDYRISTVDTDAGRFPARLAVVRVTAADTECFPNRPRLVFSPLSGVERPPWHECLGDIPEVSEVFFLQETDFPQESASVGEMTRRARGYGARLCLVYGESDLASRAARVIGALIDTRSGEILATLAAGHEPRVRGFEADVPLDRHQDDNRHADPRYQAALKFRGLVHDCVQELKEREVGEVGTQVSWLVVP